MAKTSKQFVEGASASLTKSIQELEDFLDGLGLTPATGKLRKQLHEKIGDLSQKSFERGFRRGCIEMEKAFPTSVNYEAKRAFFGKKRKAVDITWNSKRDAD
jgi:hypothetical protein